MKSIRSKFTFLTLCAIAIAISITTIIAVFDIYRLGHSNANQMLLVMCETGQKNLNAYFDSAEQSVTKISELAEKDILGIGDEELLEHLERMRSAFEKIMYHTNGIMTYYYRIDPDVSKKVKGFWYTNLDGEGFSEEEVTDITLYDTNDTSELQWFTVPKATGKPVWLSPYITESIDVRVISYNAPIYWNSEFIGVVGVEIDYSLMSDEVNHITLYDNGYAFISDMEGNLIYHPHIDATILTDMSRPDVPPELLTENSHFHYNFDGVEKLGVWLPLDNGMRLNVSVPISEVHKMWKEMIGQILIASIILVIALGVIISRFALKLTKPLNELTKATRQVNSGNYDIKLDYNGNDEIGILTETFSNLVSNLQDEIHALAESEQANKAKTSFLSNMSHEIRTPITTVLGMNEIISRETKDESILGYCNNIRKAGNNLLGIINDILDFSKIETGKMELVLAAYSIRELIEDLYNMVQLRASDKGLSLHLDIDPHLPTELIGDVLRIRQVIINLLTNAIKYTAEGSVTFTVSLKYKDEKKATLYVGISDTGIGIKEEEMYKLFEMFDRLDTRRTYTIEGSGLGLAITKRLLIMMGTDIDVESTYNKGSTFSFILDQEISDPTEIGQFDIQSLSVKEHIHLDHFTFVSPGSHILIVDDTSMNLEVMKGLLKPTQIQIDTAESGAECIELFSTHHYDMVFLDYRMPKMNGLETLNVLKEKEPEKAAATPIVLLTANAIQGERERMIGAGFTDYLTKPVNISDMDAILLKYLPEDAINSLSDSDEDIEEDIDDIYEGIPKEAFKCSWIDPKEGVEYCGSGEAYMMAIELFAGKTEENVQLIEKCVSEGDIEQYIITLHSLKGSSLFIGMKEFSARAKELEFAGRDNNIEKIKHDTPDFLKSYRKTKEDLEALLAKATNQ